MRLAWTSMAHHIDWGTPVDWPLPDLACSCAVAVHPCERSDSDSTPGVEQTATSAPLAPPLGQLASHCAATHNER